MNLLESIFLFIGLGSVVFYFFLILKWTVAWMNYNPERTKNQRKSEVLVSVIVAVRNEENTISTLLNSLCNQSYLSNHFEIIISDDHSIDQTYLELEKFVASKDKSIPSIVYLKSAPDQKEGKKEALEKAIRQCKGELILTTDADCIHSKDWIQSFVAMYSETNAAMITGLVKLTPTNGIMSKLQALEFLSLSGTGAASVINASPMMCNGANLAFTKHTFIENGGYSYGANSPSGDDTFLMLKILKMGHGQIVFNNDPQSIVTTQGINNLKEFVAQRIRWSSKVKYYSEKYIKLWGLLIFGVNAILLVSLILALSGAFSWLLTFLLWSIKGVADYIFLFRVCVFTRQQKLLLVFLPALFLYPVYIIAGTIMSIKYKGYKWKGRQYAS